MRPPEPARPAAAHPTGRVPTLPGAIRGAPPVAETSSAATRARSTPSDGRARGPRADSWTLLRLAATIASTAATILLAGTGSWAAAIAAGLTTAALLLWAHRAKVCVVVVIGFALALRTVVAFVAKHDGLAEDRAPKTPRSR